MEKLNFEDFIEHTWDYVSENVVSDEYWNNNIDFIREVTYSLYRIYDKNNVSNSDNIILLEKISVKVCGKILEDFFMNLIKYNKF